MQFRSLACVLTYFYISALNVEETTCSYSCDRKDAEKLYSNCDTYTTHNVSYYNDCMHGFGYDIPALIKRCGAEVNFIPDYPSYCDANNEQKSIDGMCCTISVAKEQRPDDNNNHLMENVQTCIDEMVKKDKKP